MRISDLMTTDVLTVPPDMHLSDALTEMRRRRIRHLVVAEAGEIVGVLSDRDLDWGDQRVRKVMTEPVVTVTSATTVKQAADLMRGHAIGCLPVVDEGVVVGIVTVSDLLDMIRRGVEAPARPGTAAP